MSAIANPRPSSRLTRAERMAAHYAEAPRIAAAIFKLGDAVTFESRAGRIIDTPRPGIVVVKTYAGEHMVSETHPALVPHDVSCPPWLSTPARWTSA